MNSLPLKRGLALLTLVAACGGDPPPPAAAPAVAAPVAPSLMPAEIVKAADRDGEDVKLDAGRHPAALLEFCGIGPGMKVAEIASGGGYTAELLARRVGPGGVVYGVNNKFILEKFAEKAWTTRLAKAVNKNVVRVDREFDEPLPPEAKNLDVVVDNLFYHDTYWMKTDRDKMNKAIYAALKPGGAYCVIDHAGRPGTGANEVQSLHRIEEKAARDDIEKSGFKVAAESKVWRNPSDTLDWNTAPFAAGEKRGLSDRFALKFVRP